MATRIPTGPPPTEREREGGREREREREREVILPCALSVSLGA